MNLKNRTMYIDDNLHVLHGIDTICIDLIYLDPPFNSKKQWNAPIGSKAAGASFKDTWTYDDVDDAWLGEIARTNEALHAVIKAALLTGGKPDAAYLIYIAPRLIEMHRVLKDTGSLYLHCDPTMSHYLKLMLDAVFGSAHFGNEIIWHYGLGGRSPKDAFTRKHDVILRYNKGKNCYFETERGEITQTMNDKYCHRDEHGQYMLSGNKKYYLKGGKPYDSVWEIPSISPTSAERTGYPTQKPIPLLKRIITASCPKGGFVLDPFAGCATAAIAAEGLGRQWAGIDISDKAGDLVRQRYREELGGLLNDITVTKRPPKRSYAVQRSRNIKDILFGKQQGKCKGCKHFMEYRHLEVDHIFPTTKGGQNDDSNLQLLCGNCNRIKGDKTMAYLLKRLKEICADAY